MAPRYPREDWLLFINSIQTREREAYPDGGRGSEERQNHYSIRSTLRYKSELNTGTMKTLSLLDSILLSPSTIV